jgi:hypothetical protein
MDVAVRDTERMRINPDPLKTVPAASRNVWFDDGHQPQCEFCGSIRAERQKQDGRWRCVNTRQCQRRTARL